LRRVAVCLFVLAADGAFAQPFFLSRTLEKYQSLDAGVGNAFVPLGPNLVIGNFERMVAGQFRTGGVDVIDPRSGARLRTTPNPTPLPNEAFGVAVAVAGSVIVTGAPQDPSAGEAYLIDAASGVVLRTIPRPPLTGRFGGTVAAYGTRAVIGSDGGPIRVYDADPSSPGFGTQVLSIPNP